MGDLEDFTAGPTPVKESMLPAIEQTKGQFATDRVDDLLAKAGSRKIKKIASKEQQLRPKEDHNTDKLVKPSPRQTAAGLTQDTFLGGDLVNPALGQSPPTKRATSQ